MAFQICYFSHATRSFNDAEISALLSKARSTNRDLELSGLLLYNQYSFLQILEGDEPLVRWKYSRILNDPRHQKVTVLFEQYLQNPGFSGWDMGFVHTKKSVTDKLPGYSDFFSDLSVSKSFQQGAQKARLALAQFREGFWRRAVNLR